MSRKGSELLVVGKVIGSHGLRGDLRLKPFSGSSSELLEARKVFFRRDDGTIFSHHPTRATFSKGAILMHLAGVDDVDSVRAFTGCDVLMDPADFPELPEEEFYWFELEGMDVEDANRGFLGTVDSLMDTGAHDIYVVKGPFGEILVPAVENFVVNIDADNRRITVDLPEGLVPEPDEF